MEQFDPSRAHQEVAKRPAVQQIRVRRGDRCLPLTLVNESVVSRGTYLPRAPLARAVGQGQGWERSAA